MSGYYGGRAETTLQRVIAPVVYLDFLSMFPTVTILMKLWKMFVAEKVTVIDDTGDIKRFVENVTLEDFVQSRDVGENVRWYALSRRVIFYR